MPRWALGELKNRLGSAECDVGCGQGKDAAERSQN